MKQNIIPLMQRAMEISGHLSLPNLSNSVRVAKLRYIQSIGETPEYRNPDTLAQHFLPAPLRWLSMLQARVQLRTLRGYPFYYYLIARTKYYDQVFLNAIYSNINCIINIGSGTDTRAYRFAAELEQRGIEVLECDQAQSIAVKEALAKQKWRTDHVAYASIDLNDRLWPELESRLAKIPTAVLVMLEGVSGYIDDEAFDRFLNFLATRLNVGSFIAYDYTIRSTSDDFEFDFAHRRLFRLPATKSDVIAYHEALGYKVERVELSSELLSRLLPNLAISATRYTEDGLIILTVSKKGTIELSSTS